MFFIANHLLGPIGLIQSEITVNGTYLVGERKPACVIVALLRASKMAGHINLSWKLVFI